MPKLDASASCVIVRTRATGLLAKLAHDLEIRCRQLEGDISEDGETWRARLRMEVRGFEVVGVIKGSRVDENVLSRRDVAEIERKIRREVLPVDAIEINGTGTSRKASLSVKTPRGQQSIDVLLSVQSKEGARHVQGATELSLRRLGIDEVKGPLGAFKVDDRVEVEALLVLRD